MVICLTRSKIVRFGAMGSNGILHRLIIMNGFRLHYILKSFCKAIADVEQRTIKTCPKASLVSFAVGVSTRSIAMPCSICSSTTKLSLAYRLLSGMAADAEDAWLVSASSCISSFMEDI